MIGEQRWFSWLNFPLEPVEESTDTLHFIRQDWNIDDTHLAPEKRSWPDKHNESITGSAIPALPSADQTLLGDSPDLCLVM